jgi:hypothetical protein
MLFLTYFDIDPCEVSPHDARCVSASVWRERVGQWRASGISIASYAAQLSYPADRLRYWAQRLRREERAAPLIAVQVQPSASTSAIELRGPSGWSLRLDAGADPAWLAAVLSGLR